MVTKGFTERLFGDGIKAFSYRDFVNSMGNAWNEWAEGITSSLISFMAGHTWKLCAKLCNRSMHGDRVNYDVLSDTDANGCNTRNARHLTDYLLCMESGSSQ